MELIEHLTKSQEGLQKGSSILEEHKNESQFTYGW